MFFDINVNGTGSPEELIATLNGITGNMLDGLAKPERSPLVFQDKTLQSGNITVSIIFSYLKSQEHETR